MTTTTMRRISPKSPQRFELLDLIATNLRRAGVQCEVVAAASSRGGDDDTDEIVASLVRGKGYLFSDDARADDALSALFSLSDRTDTLGILRADVAYMMTCCGQGTDAARRDWESAVPFVIDRVMSPPACEAVCLLDIRWPQPGRLSDYGVPLGVAQLCERLWAYRSGCQSGYVDDIDGLLADLLRPYKR